MKRAKVNEVELEYELFGTGEPVLLIHSVLADGFKPLMQEPPLSKRYQLIHYHRRGWVGSTKSPGPVSIAEHAADAAALLGHLGVSRAHIAGHSSGAAVGVQLAIEEPSMVKTLVLLELSPLSLPHGQAFLQGAGPVLEAYGSGDHEGAFAAFMSAVSGMDWPTCRALLDHRVPGMVEQSIKDADTFFGVELPSLAQWSFGQKQAQAIKAPVLSVLGSGTLPLWVEVAAFLRSNVPHVEELKVDDVGHLLHIQRSDAIAKGVARFLAKNAMISRGVPDHNASTTT